jgi:phage repressor protein C with HTH and peptisase S24 domain
MGSRAKLGPAKSQLSYRERGKFSIRIKTLATFVGGPKQLSERSGLSRAVIGKYLSGKSDPSRQRLVKLANAAGVSIRWLVTGEGEMSRDDQSFVFMPGGEIKDRSAGEPAVSGDQIVDHLALRADWVREALRADPNRVALIEARRDSMAPTINDGDLLLVEVSGDPFALDGIYVIIRPDGLAAKRLVKRIDGTFEIRSDNPLYGCEVARPEALKILGRVIWHGRRL